MSRTEQSRLSHYCSVNICPYGPKPEVSGFDLIVSVRNRALTKTRKCLDSLLREFQIRSRSSLISLGQHPALIVGISNLGRAESAQDIRHQLIAVLYETEL